MGNFFAYKQFKHEGKFANIRFSKRIVIKEDTNEDMKKDVYNLSFFLL